MTTRVFDPWGNEVTGNMERKMKTQKIKQIDYVKQAALMQVIGLINSDKLTFNSVDDLLSASEKIADWMTTEIEQSVYSGCGCGC